MKKEFLKDSLQCTLNEVIRFLGQPADLKIMKLSWKQVVIYLDGLVDEAQLQQRISQERFPENYLIHQGNSLNAVEDVLSRISTALTSGHALILTLRGHLLTIEALPVAGWQKRPIKEPTSESLIRGPREGFTETIAENTAMIRRWIRGGNLRVDQIFAGERTQTEIRLLYLANVADPTLVREVERRITAIKIDGVLESGYLEQLITDNRLTVFPLLESTERSDKVAAAVLEGRVTVLVDKSPFALIAPTTINELYQSPEDYYFNFYLGSFLRCFRLLGNNLAVAISGLYVALSSFNPELLPTSFAYSITASRRGIPYPIFMEVLLLEVIVEIFREAGLRLPRNINQTLGVVTGIGLALAAVQTNLISGASLVVVAIGALASFSAPSFSVGIPWRIFKFLLILGAAFMGIVGLTLTGILILAHAATLTSFGASYLAPWAPVQLRELRDAIFRQPLWLRFFRPKSYHPHDRLRMGDTRNEEKDEE